MKRSAAVGLLATVIACLPATGPQAALPPTVLAQGRAVRQQSVTFGVGQPAATVLL